MSARSRQFLTTLLLAVCLLSAMWAIVLFGLGGFEVGLFGMRVSSHDPVRPAVLAAIAFGLALAIGGLAPVFQRVRDWSLAFTRVPIAVVTGLAIAVAVAVTVAGIAWNTRSAAGSDAYGYVSQAELFVAGSLHVDQPWVSRVPWPDAAWSFSPLGYRPRGVQRGGEVVEDPTALVPTYSPGLPILMAAAKRLGGQCALYAVVPLSGGILVLATYGIGRRIGAPGAGLTAAWLIAASPIVLFQIVQPMSDVPEAAAWAVAFWCLLGESVWWITMAGLASGLAVLIRPNLVPVAALVGVWLLIRAVRAEPARRRRVALSVIGFGAALVPSIAAVALLNRLWYGSPLNNGYAPLGELFAWGNVALNLPHYTRTFVETQTPFALAGVAALGIPALWPVRRADRSWIVGLFAAAFFAIVGEYLLYEHFDYWFILRLLLPAWPIVMLGFAAALLWPVRLGKPFVAVVVAAVAVVIGLRTLRTSIERNAFDMQEGDRRYADVGDIVRAATERNAVVISMQHSGSVRYYGGRVTLQYMHFDREWLDRAVAWFAGHGIHPYAVLDDWEVPVFRDRFGPSNAAGKLDMTPLVEYNRGRVVVYDLLRPANAFVPPQKVFASTSRIACVPPAPAPRLVPQE